MTESDHAATGEGILGYFALAKNAGPVARVAVPAVPGRGRRGAARGVERIAAADFDPANVRARGVERGFAAGLRLGRPGTCAPPAAIPANRNRLARRRRAR